MRSSLALEIDNLLCTAKVSWLTRFCWQIIHHLCVNVKNLLYLNSDSLPRKVYCTLVLYMVNILTFTIHENSSTKCQGFRKHSFVAKQVLIYIHLSSKRHNPASDFFYCSMLPGCIAYSGLWVLFKFCMQPFLLLDAFWCHTTFTYF